MSHNPSSQSSTPVGVGIDTHRYHHQATFLNADRQPAAPPLSFPESTEGYGQLRQALAKIQASSPDVHFHIRFDVAGQYALNLVRFVRDLPFPKTVSLGEPARNKHYRQAISPKCANDAVDSYACGRFAVVERPPATPEVPEAFQSLREVAGRLESQVRQTTRAINGLHGITSRVFPELASLANNFGANYLLELLSKYPTPERIAKAHIKSLTAIPYLTKEKAEKIQAAAKCRLVGYFGVFPEENTSGKDKYGNPVAPGTTEMSRQGNDLVRRYLWMAALSGIRHNPAIKALYARLRRRGKRGDVALGHCMRKLLHLVFAVWKTNRPFDATHYPWDQAAPGEKAQEETAGRNRDLPEKQAITAAVSSVDAPADPVKQPEPPRPASNRRWVDFAWLRQQVTMEQVLSQAGCLPELSRRGSQRRGRCPVHAPPGERDRSFSADLQKNVFQCFHPQCGIHGNVLDFWVAWRRLPLREAALDMAETFHLPCHPNREEEPVQPNHPNAPLLSGAEL